MVSYVNGGNTWVLGAIESSCQARGLPYCSSRLSHGINGEVISTPGHTEGSISVIIDNQAAIVGDLISSGILLGGIIRKHKAKRPPFEDNPLQVSQELQSIANKDVETFYMGHGGPLPQKEVLSMPIN